MISYKHGLRKDITSNKEDEIMNETDKKENSNEICILYIEDNDDYLLAKHSLEKDKNIAISVTRASNYLRRIIKIISQKAGISWVHPHSFRHYAATNLLRAGVNIRVVQAILGHSSIRTTGNYLHIIENDLHQAIANPHIEDPLKTRPYKIQKCLAKPLLI